MPKIKQPVSYPDNEIINRICMVRGQKVMADKDLAELYGVPTSRLNEAVKRNKSRFPPDFMFQLEPDEYNSLRSQIAILDDKGRGRHSKFMPYVFIEQGVAMLSSVLRSERAVQVNIQIVRVYTKMKSMLPDNKDLWLKIEEIEQALSRKDLEIDVIFETLKSMLLPNGSGKKK